MYIDLNVPIPSGSFKTTASQQQSKKGKGKQPAVPSTVSFTPAQISALENHIDLLVHLGYTVLAFNQIVQTRVDPKAHVNVLDALLPQLRNRPGIVFLKRLTIVLDEDSEKGFGLTNQSAALFAPYDLIALFPTTLASFSLACLTHTQPSPLTAHIIALPLTLPRLPFHLKHTMVRTALKNGAVFEIAYAGALGAEGDPTGGGGEGGAGAKRNWWAAAREVVRVTKGKGILVSGGVVSDADLRAPRDVGNLITMLGLAQNVAHDASTKIPQSLVLRAQTRKTYRAVFSEPKVVFPDAVDSASSVHHTEPTQQQSDSSVPPKAIQTPVAPAASPPPSDQNGKKRRLDEGQEENMDPVPANAGTPNADRDKDGSARKRKKKKVKEGKA